MPRVKLSDAEITEARRQICDVALRLFARDGYEAVTMRAIAAELGWSSMKAYRYFATKQQIFIAVRSRVLVDFAAAIDAGIAGVDDPLKRLAGSFRAYAAFAIANPHAYKLAFEFYEDDMVGFPIATNDTLRSWTIAYAAAQKAAHVGQLSGDPSLIVHTLWCAVHGLIELERSHRLIFGQDFEALIGPVIDGIIAGHATARAPVRAAEGGLA